MSLNVYDAYIHIYKFLLYYKYQIQIISNFVEDDMLVI
jgi:hypothetical protein